MGLLFTGTALFAQDIPASQVPSIVINQFNIDFPKAKDVEWELESNGYKVDFEQGWNKDFEAWYSAAGDQIKLKEELSKNNLPKAVSSTLKSTYPSYHIDDAERITENKTATYKLEIEKRNHELTLYFNEKGIIIK